MTATDNKILKLYEDALLELIDRGGDDPYSDYVANTALAAAQKIREETSGTQDCSTCENEQKEAEDCPACWEGHAGHFPNWKPREKN